MGAHTRLPAAHVRPGARAIAPASASPLSRTSPAPPAPTGRAALSSGVAGAARTKISRDAIDKAYRAACRARASVYAVPAHAIARANIVANRARLASAGGRVTDVPRTRRARRTLRPRGLPPAVIAGAFHFRAVCFAADRRRRKVVCFMLGGMGRFASW